MDTNQERFPFDLNPMFLKNPLMTMIKLARFKFVAKMLSKQDQVLDIGCGNGISSYFYSFFCQSVHGVDLQEAVQEIWKKYTRSNLSFSLGNILEPNCYQVATNMITCVDVIEHFSKNDGARILNLSRQALNQNSTKLNKRGTMIVGTPNYHSSPYRAAHNREHHLHEYEPDELQALCEQYFSRTFQFSMNDEVIHTGFNKLSWFFFIICII